MVDVGYFCMMFLRPLDYGYQYRPIENHPLLLGTDLHMHSLLIYVAVDHFMCTFQHACFLHTYRVSLTCALTYTCILLTR